MRDRDKPRKIPDRSTYFTVETQHQGVIDFRTPNPVAGFRALQGMAQGKVAVLLSAAGKATDPAVMLRLYAEVGPDMGSLLGYFVGVAWRHRDLDLEAADDTKLRRSDPLAWGEEVIDELHEAGWTMTDMVATGALIVQHWIETVEVEEGVADRVDFGAAPRESESSPSSTSESTTSGTPGASAS